MILVNVQKTTVEQPDKLQHYMKNINLILFSFFFTYANNLTGMVPLLTDSKAFIAVISTTV